MSTSELADVIIDALGDAGIGGTTADPNGFFDVEALALQAMRLGDPSISNEEGAERVERLMRKDGSSNLRLALETRLGKQRSDGTAPTFELRDFIGRTLIRATNKEEVKLLANLRELTPAEFEVYCACILHELGLAVRHSGQPNDSCVDFEGRGLPFGKMVSNMPETMAIHVFGQAKRYAASNLVSLSDLREFVGGAMYNTSSLRRHHGISSPLLLAFWTTSDFAANAKSYAREMGIWYLNGITLAQLAIRLTLGDPIASIAAHTQRKMQNRRA